MKSPILILTTIVAILGAEGVLAAKSKCDFREDTNDFFSGVPTLRTSWAAVNSRECGADCNARGSLSMVREAGNQWLEFDVWFTQSYVFVPAQAELDGSLVVTAAAKLEVTLGDGTVVELPIVAPVDGTTNITYPYEDNNDNYLVHASARMQFELSQNALSALGGQDAATIRLLGEGLALTMPVPKKEQTFRDAATCLQTGGAK
jgi:hypothetical protein